MTRQLRRNSKAERTALVLEKVDERFPQYLPGTCILVEEWDGSPSLVMLDECRRDSVTMVYIEDHREELHGPSGPDWRQYTRHTVSWAYLKSIARDYLSAPTARSGSGNIAFGWMEDESWFRVLARKAAILEQWAAAS